MVLNGMLCLEAPPTKETPKEPPTTTEAPSTEAPVTDLPPTESSQLPVVISEAPTNLNESLPIGAEFELSGDFDKTIESPEHQTSTPLNSQTEDDSLAPSPLVVVSYS